MFVVLDTKHLSELVHETPLGLRLQQRLLETDCDAFTTVITAQEVMQGWIADINRHAPGRDQVTAYRHFLVALKAMELFTILPFDDEEAERFHHLRAVRRRTGTMDLKIAAICVSHDALLLTRNLADFTDLAGLRVENWLD